MVEHRRKIGIALGSGTSRGWSHIGVLNALVEHDVPVDVVRAMGADVVIAVDLNTGLINRGRNYSGSYEDYDRLAEHGDNDCERRERLVRNKRQKEFSRDFLTYLRNTYATGEQTIRGKFNEWFSRRELLPGIIDIVDSSIGVMQERITRTAISVDPPDIVIRPELAMLKMLEYDRVDEVIQEGYEKTTNQMDAILRCCEIDQ